MLSVLSAVSTAAVIVKEIKVTGPSELSRGNSRQYKAAITPSNASNQNVKWSVSVDGKKTTYASVNESGKVTVKSDAPLGIVITVRATAQDGSKVSGTRNITVKTPVKSASIQNSAGKTVSGTTLKLDLSIRTSYTLKAVSDPAKASGIYVWKSSDKSVATVNSKGVVSFLKNGKVTITATARDGTNKKASVTFNVITSVTGIDLSGLGPIEVGETRTIKAKVSPSTASSKGIEWSVQLNGKSSKLVSISKGKVTVSKNAPVGGIIRVTAAAVDGSKVFTSGEMKITGPIPVKTITIEGTGPVEAGGSRKLTAAIEPADATNKKVKWSVVLDGQKSDLVSVSNGTVTVDGKVSGGSVITVTAAAADGSGVSTNAKMRITGPVKVKSITIEGVGTIKAGKSRTLTAVVEPANADNKKLRWYVSLDGKESDLVTVSEGKVTVSKKAPNGSVVTVLAKAADGSGVSAKVKMKVSAPIPVSSIKLENVGSVSAGGSRTLTAVADPSNATNKSVEWSVLLDGKSSGLVRIHNGKITVDKSVPGGSTVTVKAAAVDGSGVSVQRNLTVVSGRPVESIKLSGPAEAAKGSSVQIRAEITPANAENRKLKWTIRKEDQEIPYASVSGNGMVTISGNAPAGIALTVKAMATDGSQVHTTKKILVKEPAQAVSILDPAGYNISWQSLAIRLNNHNELQLNAVVSPAGATDKVTWTSSDPNIAEVKNGRVTFRRNGTVTITASAADGSGKNASVYLTGVTYITRISLSENSTIVPGGSKKVTAKIYPENAANQKLNWYVLVDGRATGLASVADGEVRLDYRVPVGSVLTVIGEAADGSGIRAMTELKVVQYVPVSNIKISGPGAIAQGHSVRLKASVTPSDATSRKVKWTMVSREWTHPGIELTANGTVKISSDVPAGTMFTVRALPEDESAVYAEKYIRVVPPTQYLSILDSSRMNMTGGSYSIRLNESREFRLIAGTWPEGTSGEFTWASSDKNIAAVDANGTVTFSRDGMVTITATATDGTGASASVTLNAVTPVSEIRINAGEEYIDPGETRMLSAEVLPASAGNRNLNWYALLNGQQTSLAGVSNGQLWVAPNAPVGSDLTVIAAAADGSGVQAQQTIKISRPVSVQSISLSCDQTAYPGTSVPVRAEVKPDNAANMALTWIVLANGSEPTWARVSDGTLTVDSNAPAGTVLTVVASAMDGSNVIGFTYVRVASRLQLVMLQDAAGTNLSGQMVNVSMNEYTVVPLRAIPYPADAVTRFIWQSSDDTVASVDGSGNVTLHRDGLVTVSATASDGSNKGASVTLTVTSQKALTGIRVEGSGTQTEDGALVLSLNRSNIMYLSAVSEGADAAGNFVWKSSDPEIASVDSAGRVLFRTAGQVMISVCDTVSGACTDVPVRAQYSTSYIKIIGPEADCIQAGKSYQLSAKVFPENVRKKDIVWSVLLDGEKSRRISISKTGLLKCGFFLRKGSIATVTAAAADGSGVIGQIQLPVVGKPKKISLTDTEGKTAGPLITVILSENPEIYLHPNVQPDDSLGTVEISLNGAEENMPQTVEYRAVNCEDCAIPRTEYLYIRPDAAGYYTFRIYSPIAPDTKTYLTVFAVE